MLCCSLCVIPCVLMFQCSRAVVLFCYLFILSSCYYQRVLVLSCHHAIVAVPSCYRGAMLSCHGVLTMLSPVVIQVPCCRVHRVSYRAKLSLCSYGMISCYPVFLLPCYRVIVLLSCDRRVTMLSCWQYIVLVVSCYYDMAYLLYRMITVVPCLWCRVAMIHIVLHLCYRVILASCSCFVVLSW